MRGNRSRDVTVKYDEVFERHLKRRKIHTGDPVFNNEMIMKNRGNVNGRIDKQYLTFLAHVRNDGEQTGIYEEEDEDEDEPDPLYAKFLNSLRKDGKSYTLTTTAENGEPLHIFYEVDDGDHVPLIPRKNMSKAVRDPSELINEDHGEMRKRGRKPKRKAVEISTLRGYKEFKQEFLDPGEPYLFASHRKCVRIDDTPAVVGKRMENCDPCYKIFLDNIESEYPFVVRIGDIAIEYEKVQSSVDSEFLVTSNVSDFNVGNRNPFVTSKQFITSPVELMEQPSARDHSWFKERLMTVLQAPYNEMEYKRLMMEVKKQTPKNGRHRDLRGDASLRSYPTDEYNESHLEQNTDLKEKMSAATPNRPKQLNLLRGFFFWLENLAHDGAFPPWKDPVCLQVTESGEVFEQLH